jgi:hypothetical protein
VLVAARSISSSAAALADINVDVPSMGESITEGTVAAILKQPGAALRRATCSSCLHATRLLSAKGNSLQLGCSRVS